MTIMHGKKDTEAESMKYSFSSDTTYSMKPLLHIEGYHAFRILKAIITPWYHFRLTVLLHSFF